MKETNIDCMKYRKSTHLAGIDVETIIAEKGSCILTIKEAYYAKGIDVSGNKTDGYFVEFEEPQKPMVLNSINRKNIAKIVKDSKKMNPTDSRNIGNWSGVKIELTFDESVKMMGKVVGGIRIKPMSPISTLCDKSALEKLSKCDSLESLKNTWISLSVDEKNLPTVLAKKETLKDTLK